MAELPSGTVTFLFTDLEGSTRLWEEHPEAMGSALARHDEIVRGAVERHGGHVVKTTGDGFHAVFATAADALEAASGAQRDLAAASWDVTGPLRVRMGLHTCEAAVRDGDYYGSAVNRAARLMAAAHGGQIVLSAVTAELARETDAALVDLGEHRLRDLSRAEHVVQLCPSGLPREFPPLRSLDVFPGNLPLQLTSFVGRERDLNDVAAALVEHRLVTVVGVGGVGKTRLALQVAAEVLPAYVSGAWLCELASASDAASMVEIVAATLGVSARPGASLQSSIVDFLRSRRLLLVLDNCEHLLDSVAGLTEAVLTHCPDVRVLATSREMLSVPGEQVFGLRSLSFVEAGASVDGLAQSEAGRLFLERAAGVRAGFALDETGAAAVADICRRLDGMPLAIELAAARVVSLRPVEISRLLDERFRLLAGGRRTAVERHQTLRATVDWSYSLLLPTERLVFDRAGVFPASFNLEAASAIVDGDGVESWDVVDALGSVVAKSMITTDDVSDGETRYRMLETLRQYAREQLDATDDADQWRRRHAEFYAALAEELGPQLVESGELFARRRILAELDNFRAAVNWAFESESDDVMLGVRIVSGLALLITISRSSGFGAWAERATHFLARAEPAQRLTVFGAAYFAAQDRGDLQTGRRYATAAMQEDLSIDCPARVIAPGAYGVSLAYEDPQSAVEFMLANIPALRELGDEYGVGTLRAVSAIMGSFGGDPERARDDATAALVIARRVGNPTLLVTALAAYGQAWALEDEDAALAALEESIALHEQGASDIVYDGVRQTLARLRAHAGDRRGALVALREGLQHASDDGNRSQFTGLVVDGIEVVARLECFEIGAVLVGVADGGPLQELQFPTGGRVYEQHQAAITEIRSAMKAERYETLVRTGAEMTFEDVAAYAIGELDRLIVEDGDG